VKGRIARVVNATPIVVILAYPITLVAAALITPRLFRFIGDGLVHWRHERRKRNPCVHCGYSLTGNVSGHCPECGHRASVLR
jgi:hypothetical protein